MVSNKFKPADLLQVRLRLPPSLETGYDIRSIRGPKFEKSGTAC